MPRHGTRAASVLGCYTLRVQTWDWVVLVAIALLTLGFVLQRKQLGALRRDVDERSMSLSARQDRLQKMVEQRGWRDSFDLTRFNWKQPGPF